MAGNAEEFLIRLNEQVTGPASAAAGALAKLEGQIRSEQSALTGLQAKVVTAGQAVGAQSALVKDLQSQLGAEGLTGAQFDALGRKVTAATAKLLALQKAEAAAKAASEGKSANIGKLETALPGMQTKATKGNAEAAAKRHAEAEKEAAKTTKATGQSLENLADAAKNSEGPVGKIAKGFDKLKAAGAAGVVALLVVVLVAVATAAVTAAVALTRFALAAADSARSSRLLATAAAGSAAGGRELDAVISDVANKTPLARTKIAEMARAMEIAHLAGRNMQNALEAAATASSAVGDSAGAAFTSIAENAQKARRFLLTRNELTGISAELEGTGLAFSDVAEAVAAAQGVSVARATALIKAGQITVKDGLEAMNAAVQKKFGKTVAAQMLSLTTQMAKLRENFGRLFDGIDLEPFLRGLKKITDLFSDQTVTGAALKFLFKTMFDPLAKASEGIFPIISAFLRGMVVAVLASYLGYLKVKHAINDAFGSDTTSKIDWIKVAMYAGILAVTLLGASLTALVGILALVAMVALPLAFVLSLPFLIPLAIIGLLVYAIYSIYEAIASIQVPDLGIVSAFKSALAFLKSIDLGEAAGHIMDSLANGILAKAGAVGDAMKSIGKTILGALPSVLQMHSPSVLLTNQAKMAASSVVAPLEDAKGDAHDAMADLGGGRPDFAPPSGAPKGDGGGRVFNFAEGAIVFNGKREDIPTFLSQFADVIEQLSAGSPEPAT